MTLVNFSDRIKFRSEEGWKKIGALSPGGEINQVKLTFQFFNRYVSSMRGHWFRAQLLLKFFGETEIERESRK